MLEKSCGETTPRKMPEEPWPSQPLDVQVFFAQALNTGIQKPLACPDTICCNLMRDPEPEPLNQAAPETVRDDK